MGRFTSDCRGRLGRPRLSHASRPTGQSSTDDPVNHIACLDEFGLGQAVEDRRANPARVDQSGRTKHGKMLARVRKVATKLLGEVADRVLTLSQHVQQHQSFRIRQNPAHFSVQSIPLRISIALIVHWCLLPSPAVPPAMAYNSDSCILAQVADKEARGPMVQAR